MDLSPRLKSLSAFVPPCSAVADIGTGHGALPIYLVERGVVSGAIATEARAGPFESARASIEKAGLKGKIDVRMGWGLEPLKAGEADCLVIAGMGGASIAEIISRSIEVAKQARLILGPMVYQSLLRQWLASNGFRIHDEGLALEGQRLYETIVAVAGSDVLEDDIFFEVGPRLWEMRHCLLPLHIDRKIERYVGTIKEMKRSRRPETRSRLEVFESRLSRLLALREELNFESKGQGCTDYDGGSGPTGSG